MRKCKLYSTKVLSLLLTLIMVVSLVPMGVVSGYAATKTYTYDVGKAIDFAKTHCATDAKNHSSYKGTSKACDNGWLCAEFVYNCLKKGGLKVSKSGYNVARANQLGIVLQDYGTKITSSSTATLKPSHFNKKLEKGDVVIAVAKANKNNTSGHAVIYSGKTNSSGNMLFYAHNNRKQEGEYKPSAASYGIKEVYGIHFTGIKKDTKVKKYDAQKVVSLCLKKVGTNYKNGYCLAFVKDMFKQAYGFTSSDCCAYQYGSLFIDSTSQSNIPLGADVFFSGSSKTCGTCKHKCGHIGIYVGDGYIVHAWSGVVRKMKISKVVAAGYPYRGWGWHGNKSFYNSGSSDNISYKITSDINTTYNSASIKAKLNKKAKAARCTYFLSDSKSVIDKVDGTIGTTHETTKTYDCKRVLNNNTKSIDSHSFTIKKYKEKNLSSDKSYYIKITFKIGDTWWSSGTITFKTQKVNPSTPSINISNTNGNIGLYGSSSISWNKCSNADSYDVQITNNETKKSTTKNTKGTTFSFDRNIFSNAGTYSVKVTAKNDKKSSSSSLATITVHEDVSVEFYDSVGNVVIDNQMVHYGESAKLPPAPSQYGHTFVKWDKSTNNLRPKEKDLTEDGKYRVSAIYNKKSYTVKFVDGLTGAVIDTKKVEYGSAAAAPTPPEHGTAYSFSQWDKDYNKITEDTTITAVYAWTSEYDLDAKIISAEYTTSSKDNKIHGYEIKVKVTNSLDENISGRIVIALKSSKGLLLTTTESLAFDIPANALGKEYTVFAPYGELAGYVTAYVVNNYNDSGALSSPSDYIIENSDWSEWTDYEGECPVEASDRMKVETSTREAKVYRYRIRTTTTSYATSLSGYTRLSNPQLIKQGQKTNKYAYFHSGFDTSNSLYKKYNGKKINNSENDTTKVKVDSNDKGNYIYWHWCEGKSASSPANHYIGWKKTSTYKKFHAFESKTKKEYKGTSYNAYVYSKKDVCSYNYNWNGYKSKKDNLTQIYNQKYTTYKKLYSYEKYTPFTEWIEYTGSVPKSNGQSAGTNQTYENVQSETITIKTYRYRSVDGSVPDKDPEQTIDKLEYAVDEEYNGKSATIFIHKYTQPSDYTNEYVGYVKEIKDGKIALENVELREELSAEVGNYTVVAVIAGNTSMIKLGEIEAPKQKYTVEFYDYSSNPATANVIYSTTVNAGDTVIAPSADLVNAPEGYEFDSWGQSTANVQDNLKVYPTLREKKVVVVYVDWGAQSVALEEHNYGEALVAPAAAAVEGKNVIWDFAEAEHISSRKVTDEDGNEVTEYYATDNAIVTTKEEEMTAEVTFLGLESKYASNENDYEESIIEEANSTEDDIYEDNLEVSGDDSTVIDAEDIDISDEKDIEVRSVVYDDRVDTPNDIEENPDIVFYGWKNVSTGEYLNNTEFSEGKELENASENQAIYAPVYEFAETCDIPEADVATGEYSSEQTVTLSCENPNAVIYYTTDKSDPATSDTAVEYTTPITLTETTVLKFCAMATGMNNSATVLEMYAINTSTSGAKKHLVTVYSNLPETHGSYYQAIVLDSSKFKTDGFEDVTGYTFNGFYYDEELTDEFDVSAETISSETILYAAYTPNEYTVTFYDDDKTTVLSSQEVCYGSPAEEPTPTKEGFVFVGWDKEGYDYVTADDSYIAKYVPEDEYATVTLNKSKLSMVAGSSKQLKATVAPDIDVDLTWESSDSYVAEVDNEGLVTLNEAGMAIITVTVESTGESASCEFVVSENPDENITLAGGSILDVDSQGYLRRIPNGKNTVAELRKEFLNENLKFAKVDEANQTETVLEETDLVGTGTVISLVDGEDVIDSMVAIMTGDYDGDGKIQNKDVSMLCQKLVDKRDADDWQMIALDVNGDGEVNVRDSAMLSRYLVGKEAIV